jgi:hypothetical protein
MKSKMSTPVVRHIVTQRSAPGKRLAQIAAIIEAVDQRCLAADGPVSNTRHEMTDHEMRTIYWLAGGKITP